MLLSHSILLVLLLFDFVNSFTYHLLSTLGQNQMASEDFVSSTLGFYRFTLQSKTCQLRVQSFLQSTKDIGYQVIGFYPKRTAQIQCESLIFNSTGLFTNEGLRLFNFQKSIHQGLLSQIKETFMTIDDTGVIRLETVFANKTNIEKWITQFREPKNFILPSNNLIVSSQDSLPIIRNRGGWGFSASNGQLSIFNWRDLSKLISYQYSPFILGTNVFKDWNDFTTPLIDFEGLKYQARCGISKEVKFRSPFVFVISYFWPELRVLDQGGYQLLNIRYPKVNCVRGMNIDIVKNSEECISWFCPPETFQLNGKCIAKCPAPYFHQIKEDMKNRCVLICQAGSSINNMTRICTCSQHQQAFNCPSNLQKTPFGCICQNRRYFSAKNIQITNNNLSQVQTCLFRCPSRYYQHHQGICVSCPLFCQQCIPSNTSISYLKCIQCEQGYEINQFACKKICLKEKQQQQAVDFSANSDVDFNNLNVSFARNECSFQCTQQNCKLCQLDSTNSAGFSQQTCLKCTLPFALHLGQCINYLDQCPEQYILIFNQSQEMFKCKPVDTCQSISQKVSSELIQKNQKTLVSVQVKPCLACGQSYCLQSCAQSIYFHNKSSCFCLSSKNQTSFISNCRDLEYLLDSAQKPERKANYSNYLSQEINQCPIIGFYFNYRTLQCMKCPFGCLTCIVNQQALPQCTSCSQHYYLSIPLFQNNYCQKQTSLTYCYSFNRYQKYCFLWEDKEYLLQTDQNHIRCKPNNPNCQICLYTSTQYCSLCLYGFFLHRGKCLQKCPSGYYEYEFQPVCLPKTIDNCLWEKIETNNFLVNIDFNSQYMEGYRYFTSKFFTQIHNQNDPVGLIFMYYKFLKKKLQGQRTTTFSFGQPVCKVCDSGYGLTELGKCTKCKQNCLLCIYHFSSLCLKCHPYYTMNNRSECVPLDQSLRPCLGNEFRNDRETCQPDCSHFYKITQASLRAAVNSKIVNCTFSCPGQMKIMKESTRLLCIQRTINTKQIFDFQRQRHLLQFQGQQNDTLTGIFEIEQIQSQQIKVMSSCFNFQDNSRICVLSLDAEIENLSKKLSFIQRKNAQFFEIKTARRLKQLLNSSSDQKDIVAMSDSTIVLKNIQSVQNQPIPTLIQFIPFELAGKSSPESPRRYLGNSLYNLDGDLSKSRSSLSMLDSILLSSGLNNYGRYIVLSLLVLVVINIGKGLDYKVDNVFITMGVLYLILTGLNLQVSGISYQMYSWMYGFAYSTGLQTFSNPRKLTENIDFMPKNYLQKTDNNAHLLIFVDDCFLRNCWSILLLWIIMVVVCTVNYTFIWLMEYRFSQQKFHQSFCDKVLQFCKNKSKQGTDLASKDEIKQNQQQQQQQNHVKLPHSPLPSKIIMDNSVEKAQQQQTFLQFQEQSYVPLKNCNKYYPNSIRHSQRIHKFCIFLFQTTTLAAVYYIFLQLKSSDWQLAVQTELFKQKVLAFIVLILILLYFVYRIFTNLTSALYTGKRIALATVLAFLPAHKGIVGLVVGLIFVEIAFCLLRILLECRQEVFDLRNFLIEIFIKPSEKEQASQFQYHSSFLPYQDSNEKLIVVNTLSSAIAQTHPHPNSLERQEDSPTHKYAINISPTSPRSQATNQALKLFDSSNVMRQSSPQQNPASSQTERKCGRGICERFFRYLKSDMSLEMKTLLIQETLIMLFYALASINHHLSVVSVIGTWTILLIFLIVLIEQLIMDVIELSQMKSKLRYPQVNSQNRKKGKSISPTHLATSTFANTHSYMADKFNRRYTAQNPIYFKIRNNFDFEYLGETGDSQVFDSPSQMFKSTNSNH